ncbi:hypothetical protein, partial [Ottowia sp.]|uniref:hypothetical protein n=1 Tax=Ottowia sp. TaxID=1898956 RepID=UPI002CE7E216
MACDESTLPGVHARFAAPSMPGPRMVFQGKKQNAGLPTRKENAMRKITWTFWLLIGGLTALWLLADTLWPAQAGL